MQPILTPVRSVALAAPGRASPLAGSAQLQVVGPLPEEDVTRLLSDVPLDAPPWKIVADMRHARLYFGRPGVDPCCFEEWTYVRDADVWRRVDVRSYSH